MQLIGAACAGFLLAVLWMDLIFDSQVLRHRGQLPERVLESIAAYYHRATTAARPMNYVIAVVMLILLGALAFRWVDRPRPSLVIPTVLAAAPMLLAAAHTVPSAKRLARRVDSPQSQSGLARGICRDHVLCLASMSVFLVFWMIG